LQPVLVAGAVGLAISAVDVLVAAFAERHGHGTGATAWALAALSAGSAVGGLVHGAVDWRTPARVRLSLLAGGGWVSFSVRRGSPRPCGR
jgi:hypothetical protein